MDDSIRTHSWFSSGTNKFNNTPTIAARDIPEIAMDKSPDTRDNDAPPKPKTSMVAATTTFLVFVKSTWLWINILRPFTQMNPYNNTEIPPKTGAGISVLLYGFICVNGLKILIHNQVDFTNTKNVVVAATMLVLGLGGATLSVAYGDLSMAISGMSLAAIVGVLLNLVVPEEKHE